MKYTVRDFSPADAQEVDRVAISAFEQFREQYIDWPGFASIIARMASLSETAEIIVAESEECIIGAVGYIGPGKKKNSFFNPDWAIMRMLVVQPSARGNGVGRSLADECLVRAERDNAKFIALHTSNIMNIALPIYQRMGFNFLQEAPPIHSVPYGIYIKQLGT